jgi:hypothetical protein
MTEDTRLWYMIVSAIVLMSMGYKWSRKGFINANTKILFLTGGIWGIYEIVRMVM